MPQPHPNGSCDRAPFDEPPTWRSWFAQGGAGRGSVPRGRGKRGRGSETRPLGASGSTRHAEPNVGYGPVDPLGPCFCRLMSSLSATPKWITKKARRTPAKPRSLAAPARRYAAWVTQVITPWLSSGHGQRGNAADGPPWPRLEIAVKAAIPASTKIAPIACAAGAGRSGKNTVRELSCPRHCAASRSRKPRADRGRRALMMAIAQSWPTTRSGMPGIRRGPTSGTGRSATSVTTTITAAMAAATQSARASHVIRLDAGGDVTTVGEAAARSTHCPELRPHDAHRKSTTAT